MHQKDFRSNEDLILLPIAALLTVIGLLLLGTGLLHHIAGPARQR